MPNENVNKVILGTETLLDLTEDTVQAADVAAGKSFHLASGARTTGTASYAGAPTNNGNANTSNAILYATVDSTSTETAFTATVAGLDALVDGTTIVLKNGVITSAAGFTIDVNGLGAKPVYTNLAAATAETTKFNVNYTMMFVYDSTRVEGGAWLCYNGYDSNTNTIGYQLRTNSGNKVASDTGYRYRLWFTSADGSKWVPANTSTSTSATGNRSLNTRAIDPFGPIVYRSTNGTCNSGSGLGATGIWQQYTLSIGYSYMASGFSLTFPAPVYLKCTPNADGSATMNSIVQALPTTKDGKIYIHLGTAYSATNMELQTEHPVYWHDGTGIRIWTGAESGGSSVEPSSTTPSMDGTAAVGTATTYARADHVHPTDTSRQETLVSGTNIKTINNESILGSGNIAISGGGTTTWYGTCNTSQATAEKAVVCEGFELSTGAIIGILFLIGNAAATPTLNVNSTGAKSIYVGSSTPSSTTNTLQWSNGTMCYFMYDGSGYRYMGSFVGGIQQQPRGAGTWFGFGSGTATSKAKSASISNFFLTTGALVTLKFTNANTYTDAALTLNISSTGASNICYRGAVTSATNTLTWDANTTITFMYYSAQWHVISISPTQSGLPSVTSSDNGKVLQVVNGAWAAASLPSASGVSF